MKKNFFNSKLLILLLIPLFEPIIFAKIPVVHYLFAATLFIEFLYLIIYYIKAKEKLPKIIVLVIIYRLLLFFPTFRNSGDYVKWGYLSIVIINIVLLLNISLRENKKNCFDTILKLFNTLIIVDLLLGIKYPNGLLGYNDLNFLGIRTRITDYAFPLLVIACYQLCTEKRKKLYIFSICVALFSFFYYSVSTAIIGIIVFGAMYFAYSKKIIKSDKKIGSHLFLYSLVITYLIVEANVLEWFNPLIEELFGKTSTLSGRTQLWEYAKIIIMKHPIFGMGIINDGNFIPVYIYDIYSKTIMLRQAHNQFLQSLYDGGIISTFFFYDIIYRCIKKTNQFYKSNEIQIFAIGLFALLIMMITEIYSYYPAPYLLIFICYYSENLVIKQEKETKSHEKRKNFIYSNSNL